MIEFQSVGELLSVVANIIFPLIIFFQWHKSHAKEQAAKNSILASRRMVERIHDQSSIDVLDSLDATLATLGGRRPFREAIEEQMRKATLLFKKEDSKPILNFSDFFKSANLEDETERVLAAKKKGR